LAIVVSVAQTGRALSFAAARPKFSRINPQTGIRRLFGVQTVVQLAKQVLKLAMLSGIAYSTIHSLLVAVVSTRPVGLAPIIGETVSSIFTYVRSVSLIALLIGLAEYGYQRRTLTQSLKMTKWEVKEEAKASEGNSEVKGEIKKRMYAMARSRVMQAMRQADVVVTNPTHFAVALQYAPGTHGAPRVVAKGSDKLATLIRERAKEEQVPIVEDPPLARYLFAVCEVDQLIPGEIYFAVARLLAFVYSLPAGVRTMRVHQAPPSRLPEDLAAVEALPPIRRRQARSVLEGIAS